MLQIYKSVPPLTVYICILPGFRKDFFANIYLCPCMTIWLSLRSSSSSKLLAQQATGVGVTDETLHCTEES
jgi:hypothetical protein